MKTLHLLRHAKSDWDGSWSSDHERPLNERGRSTAPLIGSHIAAAGISFDLVLCSSARRTRETLAGLGDAVAGTDVEVLDQLYGATANELLAAACGAPDSATSVLLIAHNPGIQDLAAELAGGQDGVEEIIAKYPTAGLAGFELECDRWAEAATAPSSLIAFTRPRDLQIS